MALNLIEYMPIGVIRTPFTSPGSTPIQSTLAMSTRGEVILAPEFSDGLKDISSFSHIILIYHFHLSRGYSLVSRTCLGDEEHGIFAMRQSARPNAIGFSIVKLENVTGNVLQISGVDVVDGSPLLDIKPFVPLFDNRPQASMGWLGRAHAKKVIEETRMRDGKQTDLKSKISTKQKADGLKKLESVRYMHIGVIHTSFSDTKSAPIQGVFAKDAKGEVEVYSKYEEGLKDIEQFSHIILFYHFHLSQGYSLVSMPFLEDKKHGIFSIRHFKRPNAVGISVVKLEKVKGNILEISEVDILNGTPLIDIKPFVPLFDNVLKASSGWLTSPHVDLVRGESGKHRSE
jgi:tRNA-Thr(GGU) m(6)t(6)A37 methyltransferase TsaA